MYNQPDEEFDRLCREAAENPEGHLSADGWDKLRRKLDKEMPEKTDRRPGWLLWLPLLISIPVAMYYWAQYPVSGKDLSSSLGVLQSVQQSGKDAHSQSEGLTSTNTRNQSQRQESASQKASDDALEQPLAVSPNKMAPDNQVSSKENETMDQTRIAPHMRSEQFTQRKDQHKVSVVQANESINRERKKESSNQAPPKASSVQTDAKESIVQADMQESNGQQRSAEQIDQLKAKESAPQTDQRDSSGLGLAKAESDLQATMKTATGDSTAGKVAQKPAAAPVANNKGFGFMAVFGPDFSNVHFAAGNKAGFSLGMLFEFHFNKRLSLQTGMIYEKKNYTAMGDVYGKIPGYDVNNPTFKMNKVEANCFMWEIPVNLRYNFLSGNQHRVFAAGGFSTYLMSKEDLHYYYTYNSVSKYKNWMNDRSSAYWFAVANLSIGYEYRINQLFSVQAEPYFKIPVKGMGYGDVPINSMGILFGIRYRPLNRVDQVKK